MGGRRDRSMRHSRCAREEPAFAEAAWLDAAASRNGRLRQNARRRLSATQIYALGPAQEAPAASSRWRLAQQRTRTEHAANVAAMMDAQRRL